MKQNRTIWLIVIGVLLLGGIAYLLNSDRHDWRESYDPAAKDPYGTYFLAQLLDGVFPNEDYHVLKDSFVSTLPLVAGDSARANYVFVGAAMYLSPSDVQRLLDFVASGNQAIISARILPYDFMFELYYEQCDTFYFWDGLVSAYDTLITANFEHAELRQEAAAPFRFYQRNESIAYEWRYFEDRYFCELEEGLVPIGKMNDSLINFAQVSYGLGNFYLHSTPLAFTNYYIREESGLQYADKVFSHLQEGPIYWDEYSRISERMARSINNRRSLSGRNLSSESPLQFILSQPALTWSWYLLLAGALLYMIFLSRRRQRIIPVHKKNTNTTLEFLTTIGNLYFLQNNHKQLALQKMQLFRQFVREKYHLVGLEQDEEFKQRLKQRSEVAQPIIDKIFLLYNNIKNGSIVTENTLIDFHKAMEQFYRHCK